MLGLKFAVAAEKPTTSSIGSAIGSDSTFFELGSTDSV